MLPLLSRLARVLCRGTAGLVAALAVALTGACSPQPLPLPPTSKDVAKRVEADLRKAEEEAARKRQAAEDASK